MEHQDWYQHVQEPKYECLLFDVDDTLYPFTSGLSRECTNNIIEYMIKRLGIEEDKVAELCVKLYKDYGTTMAGLRAIGYDFDYDDYHSFVHGRLPYELLKPDPVLKSILHSLPIRKVIFSNANRDHVAMVLGRLGLEDCFDGVMCFETLNPVNNDHRTNDEDGAGFRGSEPRTVSSTETNGIRYPPESNGVLRRAPILCKPHEDAFEKALRIAEINPQRTLFFDDSIRNLQTGKRLGLHTVRVGSSQRTTDVDHALESIHNIREAVPELWEAAGKDVRYSRKVAIETYVRA